MTILRHEIDGTKTDDVYAPISVFAKSASNQLRKSGADIFRPEEIISSLRVRKYSFQQA